MQQLDGPGFASGQLCHEVRDIFGRRVQQLALPVEGGGLFEQIDSRVVPVPPGEGGGQAVGWIRTLRSSGDVVYSGAYDLRLLPGAARASVHVVFPLPQGNLQVFLEPLVVKGGALGLRSLGGDFFVDAHGTLRTAHRIWLGSRLVVRLDYVMSRQE